MGLFLLMGGTSCTEKEDLNTDPGTGEVIAVDQCIADYNANIEVYQQLAAGKSSVIDCLQEGEKYRLVLSDRSSVTAYAAAEAPADIPVFGIDAQGYWIYSLEGERETLTDLKGEPVAALPKTGKGVMTPQLKLSEEAFWMVSFNGLQWKPLSKAPVTDLNGKRAADFAFYRNIELNTVTGEINLYPQLGEYAVQGISEYMNTTLAWRKYVMQAEDNVLLDFSYAGYKHGEVAPPEAASLGYKVIDMQEEMNRRKLSARETLIQVLQENKLNRDPVTGKNQGNPNAQIVIYFPAGDYVLHDDSDNTLVEGSSNTDLDSKGNNTSSSIFIHGGNLVIRGDGRGKTRLIMATPNLPTNPNVMYSSPDMLSIKHNSEISKLCDVVSDAEKGSFSVEVSAPELIQVGDWVCLHLKNNNAELVAQELKPYAWESTMGNIAKEGVQVRDFHQVVAKKGNALVFKEPIMHEVEKKWGWEICKYPHYENVGVEDLTFVGYAKPDFRHHGNWRDDGAYKPISMSRLTNSWIRRVDFESVSEALSIISSANVSAYDVNITGNRGHAAMRSAGSSRVFIGAVTDRTQGPLVSNPGRIDPEAGQYHACGVSKQSMGAVIWNVKWGLDACFEAHATQPRATLIDRCSGGFHQSRQGGDADQVPNHLNDLVIWNMHTEREPEIASNGNRPANGEYDWWRSGWKYWKILPPVIVGYHGEPVRFVQEQVRLDESHGTKVEPESLYEAQLKLRLGYVPAWLNELK